MKINIKHALCILGVIVFRSVNAGGGDEIYNESIVFGPSEIRSSLPYLTPYNDTRVNLILQLKDNQLEEKILKNIDEDMVYYDEDMQYEKKLELPLHLSYYISYAGNRDFAKERSVDVIDFTKKIHKEYYDYWQNQQDEMREKQIWGLEPEFNASCSYCNDSSMELDAFFDYIEALQQISLNYTQKNQLAYARYALAKEKENYQFNLNSSEFSEGASQDFYKYLQGASAFAKEEYPSAKAIFSTLQASENEWIKETSLYLAARISLREAQKALLDSWTGEATENPGGIALADQAQKEFSAYLAQYPNGQYSTSAKGLLRRINWLKNDNVAVNRELEEWYANPSQYLQKDGRYDARLLQLILEVDRYVVGDSYTREQNKTEILNPNILATAILQTMRAFNTEEARANDYYYDYTSDKDNSFQALVGQYQPYFKDDERLYQFLVATYYSNMESQPTKVVELLPVLDERKQTLSALEISEQILRARAFEAQKRWSAAETIWKELAKRTETSMQKEMIEAGLTGNYILANNIDRAFEPDSMVQNSIFRDSLVVGHADRDLLRRLITESNNNEATRAKWLYILLYQDVYTINTKAFFADIKLVDQFKGIDTQNVASFEYFTQPIKNAYKYQCGTAIQVMKALSENMNNSHAQMCYSFLVERMPMYRLSGSEQFTHIKPSAWRAKKVTNYDSYRRVIDNKTANKDDRALALYHGVNCYNRGINRCDDKEIPQSERKRWFDTLKREHKESEWARKQKHYW